MNVVRYKHAAVRLRDGTVLIVGGSDGRDWQGTYTTAELYDPRTRRFTATGSMHFARFKIPTPRYCSHRARSWWPVTPSKRKCTIPPPGNSGSRPVDCATPGTSSPQRSSTAGRC